MRRLTSLIPWFTALCGTALYLYALPLATVKKSQQEQLFTIPANFLRVVSGQFKELSADVSFLNALTWLGEVKTQPDTHRYRPEQYEWLHNTLKNSVALDPYFLDPYYLMNSALIWDRYKLAEVNGLIAKGADTRSWDSMLAFFAGFNYYYFLDDNDKSFSYLKEASKRSGGNPFYDSLAARVAYKANKIELAIMYLEQQIHELELQGLQNQAASLQRRLDLLKGIHQIELAVESYRKLFGKLPADIHELVKLGALVSIPKEPNGGSFYIDSSGRVKSTRLFSRICG
ncbi:hypothetical protein SAMN02745119_03369 [Trichlorobacter thiogenes]|uniref:Uncharacterized protein n=1 Tax=Trichlorobacter thiogenes TaxID=115783 RepID=A0A1T4SA69_9BACT|nr:hypothetical protein [Trichlorobacter thiogenes]SKA25210.1 hypothetical protein SAMN02745119_03369 [Trichlorobacter thiogenes]